MTGSAESVLELPTEKVKFLDDMTEAQLARHLQYPDGLKNLGNTCYMNATLQCLKGASELCDAVKQFLPANLDGHTTQSSLMIDGNECIKNNI